MIIKTLYATPDYDKIQQMKESYKTPYDNLDKLPYGVLKYFILILVKRVGNSRQTCLAPMQIL